MFSRVFVFQLISRRGPGSNSSPASSMKRAPADSSVSRTENISAPPSGKAAVNRMSAAYSVFRMTPPRSAISSYTRSSSG